VIGRTESGLAFEAVNRPSTHTLHAIVGTSLTELERRLNAVDRPRRSGNGLSAAPDDVDATGGVTGNRP
jgi:hypothetical protein